MVGVTEEEVDKKTLIIEKLPTLSEKELAELLFRALFIVAQRGSATDEQLHRMVELQHQINPYLKVA